MKLHTGVLLTFLSLLTACAVSVSSPSSLDGFTNTALEPTSELTSRESAPIANAVVMPDETIGESTSIKTSVAATLILESGSAKEPSKALPPLSSSVWFAMPVNGFAHSLVSVPVGATRSKPVVVAVHGNHDRPEWQCEVWRGIIGDRGFVLCPRGVVLDDSPSPSDLRYKFTSAQALEKEIDAGLQALKQQFSDYVADGPAIFVGFSLGAIYGVDVVLNKPEMFSRVVFIEGGERWSSDSASQFRLGGGQKILFACSQPSCTEAVTPAVQILSSSGVDVASVSSKYAGHSYVGEIKQLYAAKFDWLTEGDDRWRLAFATPIVVDSFFRFFAQ